MDGWYSLPMVHLGLVAFELLWSSMQSLAKALKSLSFKCEYVKLLTFHSLQIFHQLLLTRIIIYNPLVTKIESCWQIIARVGTCKIFY